VATVLALADAMNAQIYAIEVARPCERDPVVPTPDGAVEPRNRRVEIEVR
jgi:hypothetical protein